MHRRNAKVPSTRSNDFYTRGLPHFPLVCSGNKKEMPRFIGKFWRALIAQAAPERERELCVCIPGMPMRLLLVCLFANFRADAFAAGFFQWLFLSQLTQPAESSSGLFHTRLLCATWRACHHVIYFAALFIANRALAANKSQSGDSMNCKKHRRGSNSMLCARRSRRQQLNIFRQYIMPERAVGVVQSAFHPKCQWQHDTHKVRS